MSELRFDPDEAHKAQKRMFAALIEMNNGVERPLRNVALPEMPPAVASTVRQGVANAIGIMSQARVAAAAVASTLKGRAQELGVYDKPAELSKWWKVGDAMVFAAEFTGTDIIYKTNRAISGEGSWDDVGSSAFAFGTTVFGGPAVKGITKGAKALRASRASERLVLTAEKERKLFHGTWKGKEFTGFHHEGGAPLVKTVVRSNPRRNGVYEVTEATVYRPTTNAMVTVSKKETWTMFPRHWSPDDVRAAVTSSRLVPAQVQSGGRLVYYGYRDGVLYTVIKGKGGEVLSSYPVRGPNASVRQMLASQGINMATLTSRND